MKQPTFGQGKICYIQMPTLDPQASANFYWTVFGWNIRSHDNGTLAFDDGVGEVSGMWETSRKAAADPGMLISIMVKDVEESARAVAAAGGMIVDEPAHTGGEMLATFRDPAGNLLSLYQGGEMDER